VYNLTEHEQIVRANCSNGSGWTYIEDYRVWFITDTYLRYRVSGSTNDADWVRASWTCSTTATFPMTSTDQSLTGATLTCQRDATPRDPAPNWNEAWAAAGAP
jgi:hypothetical protein